MVPLNVFKPFSYLLLAVPRRCFLFYFLCFMFVFMSYAVLSTPCSLVIICWETDDLLALYRLMFSCAFLTFSYSVLGQTWYLIIKNSALSLFLYFNMARAFDVRIHAKKGTYPIQQSSLTEMFKAWSYVYMLPVSLRINLILVDTEPIKR